MCISVLLRSNRFRIGFGNMSVVLSILVFVSAGVAWVWFSNNEENNS
jgi:hypothetical protein